MSMVAAVLTAAGGADAGFDPLTLIGSAVTPVIVVVLFLTGQIVPAKTVRQLEERLEHAETQRDEIVRQQADAVIPALTRSTDILTALAPAIRTEVTIRRETDTDGRRGD